MSELDDVFEIIAEGLDAFAERLENLAATLQEKAADLLGEHDEDPDE